MCPSLEAESHGMPVQTGGGPRIEGDTGLGIACRLGRELGADG
jgi:hypothetical protein